MKRYVLRNLRLCVSIFCAVCALGSLLWLSGNETAMMGIQRSLALVTSGFLNLFGQSTVVVDTTVQSEVFGISVVTACTGLFTTGLFVIAVLAFPALWWRKLIGVGMGVFGIYAVNVIRLVTLYFIGVELPGFLDQAHQLVWQSLLIVIAVALWLYWAGRWAYAPRSTS